MLRLFNRFLLFVILVSVVLFVVSLNRDPAVLRLSRSYAVQASSGYIYIGVFVTGILITCLVALLFAFKAYLRERSFLKREKKHQQFLKLITEARSEFASHNWFRAKELCEKIIHQSPENIPARVELSKALEMLGDDAEALKVLEEARSHHISSPELLLRTSELNLKLGNKTAAIDNLALIIADQPSRKALEMARDLSEELGRIEDALQYQEKLELLPRTGKTAEAARARLNYKLILREKPGDFVIQKDALTGFIRKNPDYIPALDSLAALYVQEGLYSEAAALLTKAAKLTKEFFRFRELPKLWLKNPGSSPEKIAHAAISSAKSAASDTSGLARIMAEYALAETYFLLNKLDDAGHVLGKINLISQTEGVEIPVEVKNAIYSLQGTALARMGKLRESGELWGTLMNPDVIPVVKPERKNILSEPSPVYSTP